MNPALRNRRISRVAARRRSELGLTLIELLLSLAILAILTGFLAGGLSMARKAFGADRASEIGSETSAAIQTVAALVASALPARFDGAGPKDAIGFDGRPQVLSFVGLSEGRSLRGGPHKIVLRQSGGDLVVDFVPLSGARSKENSKPPLTRVVVLSGVREVRLGYFGTTDTKVKPAWRADWSRAERLPDLVSIRIEFEDERRNEPATVVALRQG
ncbi:prepilin-type N-terminal cleavage/methylation domain-containing protein [Bradyrhizobium sp. 157]|uniref:prepilin-type N-terminal cleavage/methylation domain-containing protein n=1 Tax=Bradyrhizobium sp. 157 TaxID=2782631 RepID=UPI001FFA92F8|nr:prepilin-type N-terminal cleavage/methylation domain-containing protein [Bradyrhizobium sp. 157]MCK1643017.1 prepilin-type N-terminal cleavage/methylation domain-containing protein [Bradyrhizobium sp. 157]